MTQPLRLNYLYYTIFTRLCQEEIEQIFYFFLCTSDLPIYYLVIWQNGLHKILGLATQRLCQLQERTSLNLVNEVTGSDDYPWLVARGGATPLPAIKILSGHAYRQALLCGEDIPYSPPKGIQYLVT